jgi:hypothetical protein
LIAKVYWRRRGAAMALIVETDDPNELLSSVLEEIDAGKIRTWQRQKDGKDYLTHSPEQWRYAAWMKGQVSEGELVFNIYPTRGKTVTSEAYAIYHGRFAEMLLAHFDRNFHRASATALATSDDEVGSAS